MQGRWKIFWRLACPYAVWLGSVLVSAPGPAPKLVLNQELPPVVCDKNNCETWVRGERWSSEEIKGTKAPHIIFYICPSPSAGKLNDAAAKFLEEQKYDPEEVRTIVVMNLDCIKRFKGLTSKVIDSKAKEHEKTLFLRDKSGYFAGSWGLSGDSSHILVVDTNNIVRFVGERRIDKERFPDMAKAVEAARNAKPTSQPEAGSSSEKGRADEPANPPAPAEGTPSQEK